MIAFNHLDHLLPTSKPENDIGLNLQTLQIQVYSTYISLLGDQISYKSFIIRPFKPIQSQIFHYTPCQIDKIHPQNPRFQVILTHPVANIPLKEQPQGLNYRAFQSLSRKYANKTRSKISVRGTKTRSHSRSPLIKTRSQNLDFNPLHLSMPLFISISVHMSILAVLGLFWSISKSL